MPKIEAIINRTHPPIQSASAGAPKTCPKSLPSSSPTPTASPRHSASEAAMPTTTPSSEYPPIYLDTEREGNETVKAVNKVVPNPSAGDKRGLVARADAGGTSVGIK